MRQHCRCTACQTRQVLPKPLALYKHEPKCRGCGKRRLRPDKWMNERKTGWPSRCCCDGYWFPHRAGSKWCHKNPDLLQLDPEERPR